VLTEFDTLWIWKSRIYS